MEVRSGEPSLGDMSLESPSRGLRDRLGKLVCTTVAFIALSQIPAAEAPQPITDTAATTCINPSKNDITAAEKLFNSPEDAYRKARTERGWDEQAASDFSGDYTQRAIVDINAYAAGKLDLTTYDYLSYSRKLSDDIYLDTEDIQNDTEAGMLPFSEYFDQAQEFARKYGIELALDEPYDFEYNGHVPTAAQLDTPEAKFSMLNFIQSIGVLPVELIDQANLKKVRLMYSDDPKNIGGYVDTRTGDTYVINVKFSLKQTVFDHELYHLIDLQACGADLVGDQEFRKLNGTDKVYTDDGYSLDETTSLDDISRFYDENSTVMSDAYQSGDEETYCRFSREAHELASQSLGTSDYGLTNPAEDKAEIMKGIFNTLQEGDPIPSKIEPVIYKKAMFLFGRLYKLNPSLVKFFAMVNGRPESAPKPKYDC